MKKFIGSLVVASIMFAPVLAFASTDFGVTNQSIASQPGISIQNADGSWTLYAVGTHFTADGSWVY